MKLFVLSSLVLGLSFTACKQQNAGGSEDSFIKSAVAENPNLVAPVSEPLTQGEDQVISASKDPKDYTINVQAGFEPKDVAQYQIQSESTPENLKGLWWMNGNPLADKTVSFAGMKFEAKNGKQFAYFPVFGANNYTFDANESGLKLYNLAAKLDTIYEVTFNNDFTYGEIVPTLKIGLIRVRIPKSIVEFTMTLKEDGHFVRQSKFLGKVLDDYQFVRIVDKNKNPVTGTSDGRWNQYLATTPKIMVPTKK